MRVTRFELALFVVAILTLTTCSESFAQQGPAGQLGCYGDPVCPNCGPGQCVVSSGGTLVTPGDYALKDNPACAQELDAAIAKIKPAFDSAASAGLKGAVGPLGGFYDLFGGNLLRELVRLFDRRSNCVLIGVKLPDGAKIQRTVLWMSEGDGQHSIVAADTDLPWCRWEKVTTANTDYGQVVSAVFKNWSNDRTRTATIHVLYEPRDWSARYVDHNPVSANGQVWNPRKGGPN